LTNDPLPPPVPEGSKSGGGAQKRGLFATSRRRCIAWTVAALLLAGLVLATYHQGERSTQQSWANVKTRMTEFPSVSSIPKFREIVGSFGKNQTITEVLLQQGIPVATVNQIIDCARPVYNLARVKASQLYWLCFTQDGKFSNLRYPVDDERYLTVYHDESQDRFVSVMKNFKYETRLERVSADIDSSLFAAVANIGEGYDLALDLADIFGSDIDFNTEIQKGDSFQAVVEKKYLDGRFVKNGAILAASVFNQQKLFTGFRFVNENGKPAYYAPEGRALRRSFLKAPLKVIRITSKFSKARLHPILRVVRPHLGVDYAAPVGTPVQAVAAGVVASAGSSGANGRMVRIRHSGGYETRYLHLSRIAVRTGQRVEQGAIIGNVGSTGLSTGPHLDFRIQQNGRAINPTKVIFPPGKPVSPAQFSSFAELRDGLMAKLQGKEMNGPVGSVAAR